MRTHHFVHRTLCAVVIAGLLMGPLAPLAQAQEGSRFFPLIQQPSRFDTDLVFRTVVQVRTAAQWRDLERMQPVFLERGDDWAMLLVDDAQLADLARLRYSPDQTNGLGTLLAADSRGVMESFAPLFGRAQALADRIAAQAEGDTQAADAARADLRAALQALAGEQRAVLATAATVDGDADGATDDQETWWCTDPAKPDTDFDSTSDGAEIAALKEWAGNNTLDRLHAGPPVTGQPFIGWPPDNPGCLDNDRDSIPNLAELYYLGFNMAAESTDRDQFDDGQELFGTTNCPGSGTGCGYGSLPPASNDPGVVLFPEMPGWVRLPGNHPLVAGLPVVEIDIMPSSLRVKTVTTITTDKTISQGTEKSYSTAKTEGTSTAIENTVTWNEWDEVSETTELSQAHAATMLESSFDFGDVKKYIMDSTAVYTSASKRCFDSINGSGADTACSRAMKLIDKDLGKGVAKIATAAAGSIVRTVASIPDIVHDATNANKCPGGTFNRIECGIQAIGAKLGGEFYNGLGKQAAEDQQGYGLASGIGYSQAGGEMGVQPFFSLSYPAPQFVPTQTSTHGYAHGGSESTTHTSYEEQTVTNGEAFSSVEAWSTATAVDSAHAADFWFSYTLTNRGDDFARKICDISFNVYIGNEETPVATYDLAVDLGGDGCLHNFRPGGTPIQRASSRLPLSLDELAAIDSGASIRVVLSRYVLSTEDYYATDAAARGLTIALEDGADDGDETIDTYLIPTWKSGEDVLDVLARYFPHDTDANGTLTEIWTPETRSDTPGWCVEPKRPVDQPTKALWCKHALSVADWWNVYTDGLGDGSQGFQDTPAVPGAVALFRFNQDSDHDGFSDRSEAQLGTDPDDASSFPQPEVLAGVHQVRSGSQVVATLSLLNTGFYDAYGVEAVMVAPDNSVSITNNTVGGSGKVRARQQVIVGSRLVMQTPLPAPWTQDGHAAPAAGGYYTGSADRTYTFTVANCPGGGGQVGSGSWMLNWSDGAGGSGSLNFGDGYKSPVFLPVSNGVTLALYSGGVSNGESFTVAGRDPRDTFQYTINREPYSAPLVIVSYNDPQGNHRFVVPSQAMNLPGPTDNLQVYAGQMLHDVGVEVVSHAPFAVGSNTVDLLVNNPSSTTLTGARLFLEVVDVDGVVVAEVTTQVDVPPGPKAVPLAFSTGSFNPAYGTGDDYILLAFLTDYQGNILDTGGRPLSSLQADPQPKLESAELTWDFGFVPQGSLLRKPLALANTGSGRLYTYLPPAPGLSLVRHSDTIGAADLSDYSLLLRTSELPVGPVDTALTLRTSDPDHPTVQVRVQGIIAAPTADTAGGLLRPLDVPVVVTGPKNQGEWVEFTHSLGPEPQSLHPVKVYNSDYSSFKGAGKYATAFSAGTASYEMFGDGRDGVMPASGNLDANNGVGVGSVDGTAGSTTVAVTDRYGVGRINPGDVVLIHQTQGSGAGSWELNKAASDFTGSGSFTLQKPLNYTYSSVGSNHAQIQRVPQYSACNVTGTVTALSGWNGTWGGILAVMCSGTMNLTGNILVHSAGFRGGSNSYGRAPGDGEHGKQGEGHPGPGGAYSFWAYGNGGGGGKGNEGGDGGGGGGGNRGSGARGGTRHTTDQGGYGGDAVGGPDLALLMLGGGGGSGGGEANSNSSSVSGAGGIGGGIAVIIARRFDVLGNLTAYGNAGGNATKVEEGSGGGGGGGGGNILIISERSTIGSGAIVATGGPGGMKGNASGGAGNGGSGGTGGIAIRFCETVTGTSAPSATLTKLTCYIVEQVESSPYTTGRMNLPENVATSAIFAVQYGRKLDFAAAGEQATTLRLPAGMLAAASLDLLVSGVGSGDLTAKLDIGADGSWEWQQTQAVTDAGSFPITGLAAAFNAYWQGQGAPVSGNVDVPVKVALSKPGQALLTNLQVNSAGSKLRYLRLPIRSYTRFNLALQVGSSGSTPLTVAVDIGDDGTLDWSDSRAASLPLRLLTGDLSAALNTYLDDYRDYGSFGDEMDVPIRIHVAPDQPVTLMDYSAASAPLLDLAAQPPQVSGPTLAAGADAAAGPSYQEGAMLTVQATVQNAGSRPSGPVTVAFFATAAGWGDWYIGSAFVADLTPGGSRQVGTSWNTLGFGGPTTVKAVINPYGRSGETSFANNTGSTSVNIVPLVQPPTAAFTANPTSGAPGVSVQFTDSSTSPRPITSWLWDFGDSTTSTQQNPQHIYNQVGVYTVKLTVNNGSASDDEAKVGYITVSATTTPVSADFSATPTRGIAPLGVVFQDLSSGPVTGWLWDFGDGTTSTQQHPTHTYATVGVYPVKLTVSGAAGSNSKTVAGYITVDPKQSQTITFAQPEDRSLGSPPFALSATASSGLPVSFTSSTPTVCAVSAATVTLKETGLCSIVVTQTGDGSYAAAPAVLRSFMVTGIGPTAQTITFDPPGDRLLGEGSFTLSATASSGLAVSFFTTTPTVCDVSGATVTLKAVGICTVVAYQPGNESYQAATPVERSFEIGEEQKDQEITFAQPGDRRLDQSPFTLGVSATSGLPVSVSSETNTVCTVSGKTVTLHALGECRLAATQGGSAAYRAAPPVTRSFTVLPAGNGERQRVFLPEIVQ